MSGAKHPYTIAAATTEMMWSCALATTRAAVASTACGLALWSHMLRPAAAPSHWPTPAGPLPFPPTGTAEAAAPQGSTPAVAETAATTEAPTFAAYRSAGGHATAQVTVSD